MTKTFRLEGLDCAVCASKVERAVKSLDGVKSASVNFFTTKLTVGFDGDSPEKMTEAIKAAIKKANPDITVRGA